MGGHGLRFQQSTRHGWRDTANAAAFITGGRTTEVRAVDRCRRTWPVASARKHALGESGAYVRRAEGVQGCSSAPSELRGGAVIILADNMKRWPGSMGECTRKRGTGQDTGYQA